VAILGDGSVVAAGYIETKKNITVSSASGDLYTLVPKKSNSERWFIARYTA
jgi:hypothetical protein